MTFLISFDFDKRIFLIVINTLTTVLIYKINFSINFFIEICMIITIIIDIILLLKLTKYIRPKQINKELIKKEIDSGFLVYNTQNLTSNTLNKIKDEDIKLKIEKKGIIKEHFIIIMIFFILNIIPFLNGIAIYDNSSIYSVLANSNFIGIILTYYITKENLYKHQILSIIILLIIMFFSPNLYAHYNNNKEKKTMDIFFKNCLISLLYYLLYGLSHGFSKYYMKNKFISPFYITLIESTMNLIKNLLVIGYKYYFKGQKLKNNFEFSFLTDYKFYLYLISIIIHPIGNILLIYYYSPFHENASEILGNFIFLFDTFIKVEDQLKYLILGIINVFISFVVSELIILRFCGLDYNTKREIEIRAIENEIAMNDTVSSSENSFYTD